MGSVRGVLSYGFCDFGDNFTVFDKTGEEPMEFFISKITKVLGLHVHTTCKHTICTCTNILQYI